MLNLPLLSRIIQKANWAKYLLLWASTLPLTCIADTITLAASERIPYIGKTLPHQGYVAEVATTAFAREGHTVRVEFYPVARAKKLVEDGVIQAILPIFKHDTPTLQFSNAFPGDTIGLLKQKSLPKQYSKQEVEHAEALSAFLKGNSIGLVRGGIILPAIESLKLSDKQFVIDDLQNIDKLKFGRIQFALMDKYTAADLITEQRPHWIGQFEFMSPPLAQRDFFIGFSNKRKESAQLLASFNRGLAAIQRDGTLNNILKKHGLLNVSSQSINHKTHLTIGTVNNHDMEIMQSLSKHYEKEHPGIEIEWRVMDENTLRLRLLSDLAITDAQFDIMTIGTYETPLWAQKGWLTPLQINHKQAQIEDIIPSVKAGFSHQQTLYGMPFYAESSMTFYRKDLFNSLKLVMPEKPVYHDIQRFASALHHPEKGIYGICLRGKPGWGENIAYLTTLANSFGGRWFDSDWHSDLNSDAWHRTVQFYVDLLRKYGPPHPEQNGFNENLKLFREGHCAMWVDATVAASMLYDPKLSKVAYQLGYTAAPYEITDKGSAWLWGWGLAIPTTSQHKKEALEFIEWATSKKYIHTVAQQNGWIQIPPGTRLSTYNQPDYIKIAPFAQFVLNAIQHANLKDSTLKPKPYIGIQYVSIPEFTSIGNKAGYEIARALQGELSVSQALINAHEKTNQQMKSSGYFK